MIVIKFGGHAMKEGANSPWLTEIADRWKAGERFVIVHGGGPQIDRELEVKGIKSSFLDGFRITTPEVMAVVEMVLTGTVLRSVVRACESAGLRPVGITGGDGGLLHVRRRENGRYGLVGEVTSVDPAILKTLIADDFLPIVSPVAQDSQGNVLNINADIAAGAIAGAFNASQMLFLTDVPGIYSNWPDKDSLIAEITTSELERMEFSAGMVPKVEAAIHAVRSGAQSSRVIDGTSADAFALALIGKGGTWVKP
jgi:acetylglutamate kinase